MNDRNLNRINNLAKIIDDQVKEIMLLTSDVNETKQFVVLANGIQDCEKLTFETAKNRAIEIKKEHPTVIVRICKPVLTIE